MSKRFISEIIGTFSLVFCGTGAMVINDFTGGTVDIDGLHRILFEGGGHTSTDALTGIRFLFSSGNIVAGTFRLYGIANS